MGRAAGLSRLIPPGSLLRDRSFGLFWGAHAISEAGSRITSVVAPILVYQLTGSVHGMLVYVTPPSVEIWTKPKSQPVSRSQSALNVRLGDPLGTVIGVTAASSRLFPVPE